MSRSRAVDLERIAAMVRSSHQEDGDDRALILASLVAPHRTRRRRGGSDESDREESSGEPLLSERELAALEHEHRDGISAVQVVDIFQARGLRFSEASFRKYVQQGLLPRSRRIGRKGKHRGSMGVYPAKTVRRINSIKRLMAEGYTIEEIQEQVLRYTDVVETLAEGCHEVFERFEADVQSPRFDTKARKNLKREIAEARKTAEDLLKRLGELSERVSAPRQDTYRSSGAAGSAEDLL
jgi:DNA-binding transcriptional MerR regulator